MLTTPMDVLSQFPVRKSKAQKQAFREAVQDYVSGLGYPCHMEKGSFGSCNVVIGDPETAKYLVTAHYDTCARMYMPNMVTPCNLWMYVGYQFFVVAAILLVSILAGGAAFAVIGTKSTAVTVGLVVYWIMLLGMMFGPANKNNANDNTSGVITVLEIARSMPQNQRGKVCFVLFDLEEAGLIGSASYAKAHKNAVRKQLVLNLDCVGDGDNLLMIPGKKLKKDQRKLSSLYKACGYIGKKSILLRDKGFAFYPSDQANFPYGVGIGAFHRSKHGILYYSRIHTPRDTILEETNVNILRAALTTFICCDEVN